MAFYTTFAEYYEAIFPFKAQTYVFLTSYLPAQSHRRVLDVGCGTGQYAHQFAKDGADAIGIDFDASMIAYARQHYAGARFRCLDMREIESLHERFDLIYSIGNVVSHLPQDQFAAFLQSVHNCLTPTGIWLYQTVNWDRIVQVAEWEFPIIERENGKLRFIRSYTDISKQRVIFHTRLEINGETLFDEQTPLYPRDTTETLRFHADAGFDLAANYPAKDYQQTPYQAASAPASIFIFRKFPAA